MSYYRETFYAVSQPLVLIKNDNLAVLDANPAFVRLCGYNAEELRRIPLSSLIEHCTGISQLRNNPIKRFTLITRRKKRIPIWIELFPLAASNRGKPNATALSVQDLSSQLWLRQRCDGDHVLVSGVVDEAHKIKFLLNSRPLELQEAERSDDESIFRYVEKEEWSRVLKTTAEAVKQKQARTVVIRSANLGAILDMNITFQPIFDGFGKVKENAFVLHDLKPVEKSADSSIKLKIWMAKRDINASQLAAATGITPQTISKLRNGKIIRPHRLTAELIAAELRVDVSDIWTEVRN